MIVRCKHRKSPPGDGGVVDGCGWQGPAEQLIKGACPHCESPLLYEVAAVISDISSEVTDANGVSVAAAAEQQERAERLAQALQWHSALERCAELLGLQVGASLTEDVPAMLARLIRRLDAPKKAIEVKITANGFTWEEVCDALEERAARLREHHEKGVGVSACGYGASHTAEVYLREVTREQFGDESIAWLEKQKEMSR